MDRTILELYEIILNRFVNAKRYLYICNCAEHFLNRQDFVKFIDHFHTQKPNESQYVEFYNNPSFIKRNRPYDAWFKYTSVDNFGSDEFKIRIKMLEAIIEKIKEENK